MRNIPVCLMENRLAVLLKEFDVEYEIIEYDGRIEIKYSIDYVK